MLYQVNKAPDHTESRPIWPASLESSLTGERQSFASLEDLFAFLRRETCAVCEDENHEAKAKRQ
jgi:hypothetical protein